MPGSAHGGQQLRRHVFHTRSILVYQKSESHSMDALHEM